MSLTTNKPESRYRAICYICAMSENNWKEYFVPPFIGDHYNPGTIWSECGCLVTTPGHSAESASDEDIMDVEKVMAAVVEALNAPCEGREPNRTVRFENVEYSGTKDDSKVIFRAAGLDLDLDVRGWGFLTGTKKLSPEEAASIQDEFGRFIADSIRGASAEDNDCSGGNA